jgi:hypothetical protein
MLVDNDAESVGVIHDGSIVSEKTFTSYGYFIVGNDVPGIIRRSAPFGQPSRLVIHSAHGPVFFV